MNRTRIGLPAHHIARGITILTLAALGVFHCDRAEAQFGFGMDGIGFWGLPDQAGQTVDYLHQRSLLAAQNAYNIRPSLKPVPNGPNSYMHRIRDPNFTDRFEISTRRGLQSQVARTPAPARPVAVAAPPATPAPVARPVLALASFFNRSKMLIWPADAPFSGGLDVKRATSDKASLAVLEEANTRGVASVASVSEARHLLLDYGRPALQYLRTSTTAQVSDNFHRFLLGLYEALAQAGEPTGVTPTAKP